MAKKVKKSAEIVALDISYYPEIRKIAEEVEKTRVSKSLKKGHQEIARIIPTRSKAVPTDDLWENYDPKKVRAAFKAAQKMWAESGLDADEVIADIYKAREDGSRPADRP